MIKDLIEKEECPVDAVFMIKQQTKAVSTNGNPYLSLVLQDNSGTLDAKMWAITDSDIQITQPGSLVRIYGQMQNYKGHPQLRINEVDNVEVSIEELEKFVPKAPCDIQAMKKRLDEYLDMIKDEEIKRLTHTLIYNYYDSYTRYPAAVTVHHAYLGGLMFHSLSICSMAIQVQKRYDYLSLDYLISASLLHDIGKVKELSGFMVVNYTLEGNLIGHISLGAMMVYEEGRKEKMNQEKLDVLVHMILSHHGEYEYGSPKKPLTREAYVLHVLDDLDAKLECLKSSYDGTNEGDFTTRVPWFDNAAFYKQNSVDKDKK